MQFWGVYSNTQLVNYCLPVFLLVLGDANQYQRIFASRSVRGWLSWGWATLQTGLPV